MKSCNDKARKYLATLNWVISTARNAIVVVICALLGLISYLIAFSKNMMLQTLKANTKGQTISEYFFTNEYL